MQYSILAGNHVAAYADRSIMDLSLTIYAILADAVVVLHFLFVVFACVGVLLVLRYRRLAWVHVPTFLWAGYIELTGDICPLTPLENWLRMLSGAGTYSGSFVAHYVWKVLYPAELTRTTQHLLGTGVLVFNVAAYGLLWANKFYRCRQGRRHG